MGLSFSRQYPTRLQTNGERDTSFGSVIGPTRLLLGDDPPRPAAPLVETGPPGSKKVDQREDREGRVGV
jgi:hypothetical protein